MFNPIRQYDFSPLHLGPLRKTCYDLRNHDYAYRERKTLDVQIQRL
jgi:hypothetical protein